MYSLVVPCYNESRRLCKSIDLLSSFMKTLGVEYEMIFVNDGSKDNTKEIIETYQHRNANIKLVSYEKNKGKGGGFVKGFCILPEIL